MKTDTVSLTHTYTHRGNRRKQTKLRVCVCVCERGEKHSPDRRGKQQEFTKCHAKHYPFHEFLYIVVKPCSLLMFFFLKSIRIIEFRSFISSVECLLPPISIWGNVPSIPRRRPFSDYGPKEQWIFQQMQDCQQSYMALFFFSSVLLTFEMCACALRKARVTLSITHILYMPW